MKLIKGSLSHRHIFAADKYTSGQLKLVPYSQHLFNVATEGKHTKPHAGQFIQMRMKESGGETFIATFAAASAPKVGTSNQPFATELIVPFWLVRHTADKSLANMDHGTLKCTGS